MTFRPILSCASLLACAALLTVPAQAQSTFTVTAHGHIKYTNFIYGDPFDSTVSNGVPFTYSFTWDNSVPVDQANSGPLHTQWTTSNAFEGATILLGDAQIGPGPNANEPYYNPYSNLIAVSDQRYKSPTSTYPNGIEQSTSSQSAKNLTPGSSIAFCYLDLYNSTNPLLLNLSSPGADWTDPFAGSDMEIFYYTSNLITLQSLTGTVDYLTETPEPSSYAALGIGLAGLAGLGLTARRRKSLPGKAVLPVSF